MSIRYDSQYVKKPLESFEYTREHLIVLEKCCDDIWTFLPYVKLVHPDFGRVEFVPRSYQKRIIDLILDNRFVVCLLSRQSGKTSVVSVYALWYAIFHADKTIGIVSNKEKSAIDIMSRIKLMYEELPIWIKPGVVEYAKTFILFDNGTKIEISTTSADAFRGRTINLLIMDEFASVPKHIADDFWSANYPTIAASQESKIIIISTPKGLYNLFHTIYTQAERGENSFKFVKSTWRDVPDRDEKWAEQQLANIGKQRFAQEFECDFLGSANTLIDSNILELLFTKYINPIHKDLNNRLYIYEKPIKGKIYVIGVDTAKGSGENFSALQILSVESQKPLKYKQVATFYDNHTDVYTFSEIIDRLCRYYNNAYIMCENNSEGSAVVNRLWWDLENENLVNTGSKAINLGIRATKTTKPKAVLLMKKLIEDDCLELFDRNTIESLASFVEEGGKFFGKNLPDDLVAALYWATYFITMKVLEEDDYSLLSLSEKEKAQNQDIKEEDIWGIISDVSNIENDWSWLNDTGTFRQ